MILLRDHVRVVADVFELEAPSTRRLTSGSCAAEVVKISAHTPSPGPERGHRRKPQEKHGILCRAVVTRA